VYDALIACAVAVQVHRSVVTAHTRTVKFEINY